MTYTPKTIKPSEIYPLGWAVILRLLNDNNYIIVEFRPPVAGELYITNSLAAIATCKQFDKFTDSDPRYLVRKQYEIDFIAWE